MIHITGETGLTGLLGSPVAHSISPLMHNYSFQSLGLDYVYLCFDCLLYTSTSDGVMQPGNTGISFSRQ